MERLKKNERKEKKRKDRQQLITEWHRGPVHSSPSRITIAIIPRETRKQRQRYGIGKKTKRSKKTQQKIIGGKIFPQPSDYLREEKIFRWKAAPVFPLPTQHHERRKSRVFLFLLFSIPTFLGRKNGLPTGAHEELA